MQSRGEDAEFLQVFQAVRLYDNPASHYLRFYTGQNTWEQDDIMRGARRRPPSWQLSSADANYLQQVLAGYPAFRGPPNALSRQLAILVLAQPHATESLPQVLRQAWWQAPGSYLQVHALPGALVAPQPHLCISAGMSLEQACTQMLAHTDARYVLVLADDTPLVAEAIANAVSMVGTGQMPEAPDADRSGLFLRTALPEITGFLRNLEEQRAAV